MDRVPRDAQTNVAAYETFRCRLSFASPATRRNRERAARFARPSTTGVAAWLRQTRRQRSRLRQSPAFRCRLSPFNLFTTSGIGGGSDFRGPQRKAGFHARPYACGARAIAPGATSPLGIACLTIECRHRATQGASAGRRAPGRRPGGDRGDIPGRRQRRGNAQGHAGRKQAGKARRSPCAAQAHETSGARRRLASKFIDAIARWDASRRVSNHVKELAPAA